MSLRRGGNWTKMVDLEKAAFQKALKKGVKIALGTDAGGFDWKEINAAREFQYYADYGMTPSKPSAAAQAWPPTPGWSDKLGTVEAGSGRTWSPSPAILSRTSPNCST